MCCHPPRRTYALHNGSSLLSSRLALPKHVEPTDSMQPASIESAVRLNPSTIFSKERVANECQFLLTDRSVPSRPESSGIQFIGSAKPTRTFRGRQAVALPFLSPQLRAVLRNRLMSSMITTHVQQPRTNIERRDLRGRSRGDS